MSDKSHMTKEAEKVAALLEALLVWRNGVGKKRTATFKKYENQLCDATSGLFNE